MKKTITTLIALLCAGFSFGQHALMYLSYAKDVAEQDTAFVTVVENAKCLKISDSEKSMKNPIPGYAESMTYVDYKTDSVYNIVEFADGKYFTASTLTNNNVVFSEEGTEKVLGYKCKKYKTSVNSNTIEVWMAENLGFEATPMPGLGRLKGVMVRCMRNGAYVTDLEEVKDQKYAMVDMIPDYKGERKTSKELTKMRKDKVIIRTSIIGIVTNVCLAAFKAVIGMMSNSIAVILDAVNNLSDALSSIITIIGTKLAGKQPDKKHPLGYGRIEYLSALTVAGIVFYAGVTSAVESVKKILAPEQPDYNTVGLVIIAAAVVVKIVLGKYVKTQGEKVNSGSLIASGSDALFDAILSFSVLLSAMIFILSGISLEAYVGVVISGFIIKSAVDMMTETLNEILGIRADKEITGRIKALLTEEPEVRGAYDLILYNYGPDRDYASVHLELPDTMSVKDVDTLTRKVEAKVYQETGVILVGVGVYSYNTEDSEAARIRNDVQERVLAHDWAIQFHGFYLDMAAKKMRFDVVMSFDINHAEGLHILQTEMAQAYPDYTIQIVPDVDISD